MKVFGIRHHGSGSAKSLVTALQEWQPDILLIEGPPDANDILPYVANEFLRPPVSVLVYNPKDFSQASYFPFAHFSPEWQAMKYGLSENIPIRFMDLPMEYNFALDKIEQEKLQLDFQTKEATEQIVETKPPLKNIHQKDPLAYFAHLAGFEDSERWWEVTFEQSVNQSAIFPAVIEMMSALREDFQGKESIRGLQREAYMRNIIRQAVKDGFEKIAIVCGAWHAPVLHNWKNYKQNADKSILKGIKRIKTKSTWVPWSYDRLSSQSGYKAGIISPAWYSLLFDDRKNAVAKWASKVARLFRKEDLNASSAHIIETIRLANTLATLRHLPIPGMDELYESAVSIFCEGYESKMELIEQKLIIGDVMGEVPEEIPIIPLQQDLEQQIKSARLTKERKSTEKINKKLDLRTKSNLLASHLFHRLNLLNIPWGKQKKVSHLKTGNFSELWQILWQPGFAILIIEAGMWGNTVSSAATNYLTAKLEKTQSLPVLTTLIEIALSADLKNAIPLLVEKLQNLSAVTKDVSHLMKALPSLVNAIRYGSTRKLDLSSLQQVIDQIIPRICIGLSTACHSIDEDASKDLAEKILACNHAINLIKNENQLEQWHASLFQITEKEQVNGLLKGMSTRLLFDKSVLDTNEIERRMRFALSEAEAAEQAALWIEGFLYGSALLLIHNTVLWNVLDQWIDELKMESFNHLLPLLRRCFSTFSNPERQKLMQLARKGQVQETLSNKVFQQFDYKRAGKVLPMMKLLLGIGSE